MRYEIIQLGEVASIRGGKRLPAGKNFTAEKTAHPYIRARDIGGGKVEIEAPVFIDDDTARKLARYTVSKGDVCLTIVGANVGEMGVVPSHLEGANLTENAVKIVTNGKTDQAFLKYALLSDDALAQMKVLSGGAAQPKLVIYKIETIEFPFPPLPVQRRIAGILSAYDELIENSQRRIKILEEMARSLYREWFVHFRFPGHEKVKLVESPLGIIPQGWEVKPVHRFGKVITGKTPSKANADFYGDNVPFVKTPDMHGNIFILGTNERLSTEGAESQANKTLPAGAICVSCIGTIGVVSITTEDCQTNQQINSVSLEDKTSREFLFLRLQDAKQRLENLGANGATMGNVNKSKFEEMEVVSPPIDLLSDYHQFAQPMFAEIFTFSRQIQNLRRTRDLLLPRLLSGQVNIERN
jgi:type I restriction enzyme S subunit